MSQALPVILIEVVLVFGGVLAFGWWQLRSVKRDQHEALARREALGTATSPSTSPTTSQGAPVGTGTAANDQALH